MADAGHNNRNKNRNNNRNNNHANYEEAEPNINNTRPPGSKNWRVKFANTRKVRPINKNGKSVTLGTKHKTRTKRVLASHFPDEENVLTMVGKSSYASRVASESAQLHAKHNTLVGMLRELELKPMNNRIKHLVRANLHRKYYNLANAAPPVPALPKQLRYNMLTTNANYNVSKDPLYE